MGNPKRYSKEFQERAVRRMKLGENVSQLALDLRVHRTCLYAWKRKLGRGPYHHEAKPKICIKRNCWTIFIRASDLASSRAGGPCLEV
jgi:transposase-like protein